jgi:cation transport regulator
MPFHSLKDLPDNVKNSLPTHAQEIYKEAFNAAWDEYDQPEERQSGRGREETAHAVAWAAVKKKYRRVKRGEWQAK